MKVLESVVKPIVVSKNESSDDDSSNSKSGSSEDLSDVEVEGEKQLHNSSEQSICLNVNISVNNDS